ncbi:hypothetical protein [Clostridium perfringens]|nr:hypothetical protein [Clostridium perfringens]
MAYELCKFQIQGGNYNKKRNGGKFNLIQNDKSINFSTIFRAIQYD